MLERQRQTYVMFSWHKRPCSRTFSFLHCGSAETPSTMHPAARVLIFFFLRFTLGCYLCSSPVVDQTSTLTSLVPTMAPPLDWKDEKGSVSGRGGLDVVATAVSQSLYLGNLTSPSGQPRPTKPSSQQANIRVGMRHLQPLADYLIVRDHRR